MAEPRSIESPFADFRIGVAARLGLLVVMLFAEKLVMNSLVDAKRAEGAQGLGATVRIAQHWGFRFLVTFLAALSVLAFVRTRQTTRFHEATRLIPPLDVAWIVSHLILVAALVPLSYFLYRGDVTGLSFAALTAIWIVTGAAAVVAAGLGLMSAAWWVQVGISLGSAWRYAMIVGLLGTGAWMASEKLWQPATAITFELVKLILTPVVPVLSADSVTRVIGTPRFAVEISEFCSGLEGLGLSLAFSVVWLTYFRREYIFPRALVLIPISLVAIFGLNALRIAALLLIGDAGYPEVASFGFHSQAGWIAFNAVACALVYFSRRSAWLNRTASIVLESSKGDNQTATYLMPLLTLLAAGTLAHAFSGRFETLYPLRLIGVTAALWAYRRPLLALDWRFTWRGPAMGALVFVLWVTAAHWLLPILPAPEPLIAMPPIARALWMVSRTLTAVAFVPIAEELAYRGYLMRRLTYSEFESVPYSAVRWPALTLTAIVFGAAHGVLWLPGIVAGLAYGLLVMRRGSLGEAVAAHATSNGLIAIAVLAGNQWQLW